MAVFIDRLLNKNTGRDKYVNIIKFNGWTAEFEPIRSNIQLLELEENMARTQFCYGRSALL